MIRYILLCMVLGCESQDEECDNRKIKMRHKCLPSQKSSKHLHVLWNFLCFSLAFSKSAFCRHFFAQHPYNVWQTIDFRFWYRIALVSVEHEKSVRILDSIANWSEKALCTFSVATNHVNLWMKISRISFSFDLSNFHLILCHGLVFWCFFWSNFGI